jgi:hypothetical protein
MAASAILILGSCPAFGQYGERRQQPEIPREAVQCSGTVKQIGRGVIGLVTDAGDQWVVQVQARPQDISFTGAGDGTIVKPGMWVRFSTRLTRRGDAKEPVSSLEVYTPREGFGVGISAEASGGGDEGGAFFGGAAEEKPKAEPKQKNNEDTVYRVGGQVSKISRLGELTINAAGTSVKAKLAEDAKVSIDVTDLSFLQPGDRIEIRGWHPMGRKGQAVAEQVTASAAQPLTDTSKKKKPIPMPAAEAGEGDAKKPADGEKKPAADQKPEDRKAEQKSADPKQPE